MQWFVLFYFFFSSRRRHTRFDCDWSSDVCSSDLPQPIGVCRNHIAYNTGADRTGTGGTVDSVAIKVSLGGTLPNRGGSHRLRWRSEERRVGKEGRSRGAPYH